MSCLQVNVTVCRACRLVSQCALHPGLGKVYSQILLQSHTSAEFYLKVCVIEGVCWPVISQSVSRMCICLRAYSVCIQCVLSKLCLLCSSASCNNPGWANPGWKNLDWANPVWANPGWANPGWANPGWANPCQQLVRACNPQMSKLLSEAI